MSRRRFVTEAQAKVHGVITFPLPYQCTNYVAHEVCLRNPRENIFPFT